MLRKHYLPGTATPKPALHALYLVQYEQYGLLKPLMQYIPG